MKAVRLRRRIRKVRARLRLVRFVRNERGMQLAELAIVLPLFLILFATTAEFGRFFYEYSTLAKAARAGSRYLATPSVDPTEDLRARNVAVYGNPASGTKPLVDNLTPANVNVQYSNFGLGEGTVSVSITNYQFQFIVPLIGKTIQMPGYNT